MWQNLKKMEECGISISVYLNTWLMEMASAVERMVSQVDPNFEKGQITDVDKLIIHYKLISNHFP